MSKAMELIVASYVKGRDRRALTDLLAHRRKVLAQLQAVSGINPENAAKAIQDELAVIEAALEELKPPPGSLPENEWS
ncbi:inorganic triphosphatase YgiF [Bradyrhizobium diazoefficiens]